MLTGALAVLAARWWWPRRLAAAIRKALLCPSRDAGSDESGAHRLLACAGGIRVHRGHEKGQTRAHQDRFAALLTKIFELSRLRQALEVAYASARRPSAPRHAICLCSGPCRRQIAGWCERLTHDLAEIRGRSPTSWHLAPCRGAHVGVVPCLHRGGAATHAPASADSLRPHVPAALPSVLARSPGVGRERCRRSPTTPMRSQLVSPLPHRRARAA